MVLLLLGGCAGLPAPQTHDLITVKTSISTSYYPVHGTTSAALFSDLSGNGLTDGKGRHAIGLTSCAWSLDLKGMEIRPGQCELESMAITLTLAVTLPEHKSLTDLSEDTRRNWQQFASRVADHEQRHVDICLDAAATMKARMQRAVIEPSSCPKLKSAVYAIWDDQQARTEQAQDAFHTSDEARIQKDRQPLLAAIDEHHTRLGALSSEIQSLDRRLAEVRRQHDAMLVGVDAIKAEMAASHASPANCAPGQSTSSRIQDLCGRYRTLLAEATALVDRHNEIVTQRNRLANESNRIVDATNALVERLNWMR